MSRLSILVFSPESTSTLNLHCNLNVHYCKGHVETVDTKDQSNAIVYWVWYLVCRHCRYEDQSMQCIECCAMSRLSILVFSHLIVLCIRCWVRASVSTNIAFNALCALIFVSTVSTNKIPYTIYKSIAIYTIYVDTIDTGYGSLMHSMLSMSTLLIQNTSTHFCP